MSSPHRVPIYSANPPEKLVKRHHTTRYYVHRVQESLTTRISKLVCSIFLSLLLILGIITFILWLSLRPHRPRVHIHNFSVPGLSQENGFENAQISFNVTLRNANEHIGMYYDAMDGSVFYRDQKIGSKLLLASLYQQPKTTTIITDVLSGATLTVTSQRWMEFLNDRAAGSVTFRLDLASTIRFKVSTWTSKRHRMHASCPVSVGADGSILPLSKDKRCPVYFT
ncbi:NDR1/HIN1-like protein 26 [Rhodamnia argentea]|uniref:NDR1/HIN1-like protein 26 n=1 Tax=Rhodamnia argentea TaxID=178133 RepID=A0A8B8PGX6_9MYRT|nr:NDR1/HIN1-like protein 26 [Rhodamnia argentea]